MRDVTKGGLWNFALRENHATFFLVCVKMPADLALRYVSLENGLKRSVYGKPVAVLCFVLNAMVLGSSGRNEPCWISLPYRRIGKLIGSSI